jgi:hypothetical protein
MAANDCPRCGKPVMTYGRFLREAEPTRVSPCGSCGAPLRRRGTVWLLLLAMAALLPVAGVPIWLEVGRGGLALWQAIAMSLVHLVAWVLLTSYLGFRLVGWAPAPDPGRP